MHRIFAATIAMLCAAAVAAAGIAPSSPDAAFIEGQRLTLAKRKLLVVSKDDGIDLGGGEGSVADPVIHGATLRVLSTDGDVFDTTYELPKTGWHYTKKKGALVGYAYRGKGAVKQVVVRAGKVVRVVGAGDDLGHSITLAPDEVRVVLTLGARQYCTEFEGVGRFKSGKLFTSGSTHPPTRCPLPYGEDSAWLCRPGLAFDECLANGLDTTVVHPDLSTTLEVGPAGTGGDYDCFYVYPTVDLSSTPGLHEDVTDPQYVSYTLDPLLSQVARFRGQCRIFAPHYRQTTIGSFGSPDAEALQAAAYADVLDAWRLYLRYYNAGRNVVIMAHSQGTFMTTRLIREEIDPFPAARATLIAALLIGGNVTVPQGAIVGGDFANVPLCRSAAETGCVIAFRSYAEGHAPTEGSNDTGDAALDQACTNPVALAGGPGLLSAAYFPTQLHQPIFQIVPDPGFGTPFVSYPSFYTAECVKDVTDHSYLEVRVTPGVGDLRPNPIPFDHPALIPSFLGTHILDWSWPMGELLPLVAAKAASMP
ncbi:MAG TPA: DUF3089 domain-containing protein [Candidatus Binatia bacterium]|nr:DUF3089 domain-containing protein [Candidatus Binatia bacterium]